MRYDEGFSYKIIDTICDFPQDQRGGRRKMVNIISFNGKAPVIDIRSWYGGVMQKGVTLTAEETELLRDTILERFGRDPIELQEG